MEMILTGNMMNAQDAQLSGLTAKTYPVDQLVDEAIKLGQQISELSQPIKTKLIIKNKNERRK